MWLNLNLTLVIAYKTGSIHGWEKQVLEFNVKWIEKIFDFNRENIVIIYLMIYYYDLSSILTGGTDVGKKFFGKKLLPLKQ